LGVPSQLLGACWETTDVENVDDEASHFLTTCDSTPIPIKPANQNMTLANTIQRTAEQNLLKNEPYRYADMLDLPCSVWITRLGTEPFHPCVGDAIGKNNQ
jgi:hypothetical protein